MKTKKQKKVSKKVYPKPKKKKVLAVLAKPEFYKVELEVAHQKADGTMEYTYSELSSSSRLGISDTAAQELADGLKAIGCGGRIIHLDGTPDGTVTSTWGSVARTAAAEKVEQAALEGAGK